MTRVRWASDILWTRHRPCAISTVPTALSLKLLPRRAGEARRLQGPLEAPPRKLRSETARNRSLIGHSTRSTRNAAARAPLRLSFSGNGRNGRITDYCFSVPHTYIPLYLIYVSLLSALFSLTYTISKRVPRRGRGSSCTKCPCAGSTTETRTEFYKSRVTASEFF